MKTVLTSLFLALLAGCAGGGHTGLASQDLSEVVILLRPDGEARIEGNPIHGSSLEFAKHLTTPGVTLVEISYHEEDTTGIGGILETSQFPILLSLGEPGVVLHIEGLYWELRIQPGERTTGNALIVNSTGETWSAERVDLADGEAILARSSGPVRIPPEGTVFPWWEMEAFPPDTLLVYGFPTPGRWNPLIALPMKDRPPPFPGTSSARLSNDTLWLPADHLVQASLSWTRIANGYRCTLELHSKADYPVNWSIILPDRLPRGAVTETGEGFTGRIHLPPRDIIQMQYQEVYPRGT